MEQMVVDFAQLWVEEQRLLAEIAALVPQNGTIVEIGTGEGGSALIFHTACGHKGVDIYSFDAAPSDEAYEHLKNTSVRIVPKSSKEGADTWMQTVGKAIDFLFIDGNHAVLHVFEDFNSWVPFLKPGGKIIFHDYDPVERGGLVHLGVRICVDAILLSGFLNEVVHQYRMLFGTIVHPSQVRLGEKACYKAFADLGREIVRIRDADYRGWTIIDDGQFAKLLLGSQDGHRAVPISPDKASDPNKKYVVSARPLATALDILRERGIPRDSIVAIDSLSACYIVAHALKTNREYLLTLTSSRKEFFRWEEILFMFEHAFGASQFPDKVPDPSVGSEVAELSRMVAREQVRLTVLSHLLKTFISWSP